MKKIILIIPCFLLLLTGCHGAKNKAGTSLAEKKSKPHWVVQKKVFFTKNDQL